MLWYIGIHLHKKNNKIKNKKKRFENVYHNPSWGVLENRETRLKEKSDILAGRLKPKLVYLQDKDVLEILLAGQEADIQNNQR